MVWHDLFFFIIDASEKPKYHHLKLLYRNGKALRLIEYTATVWNKVALRLSFEECDIKSIKIYYDDVSASEFVYKEWLGGNYRQPVSWGTLIQAFYEAKLDTFASKLSDILNHEPNPRPCKFQ